MMIVYFDIETQQEVPPDRNLCVMRISIAGALCDDNTYFFLEEELAGS